MIDPTPSGACLKRAEAAHYLGMKDPRTFDLIKHQIPSSPIVPGSPVHVWRRCDLDAWRASLMAPAMITTSGLYTDMAALFDSLIQPNR